MVGRVEKKPEYPELYDAIRLLMFLYMRTIIEDVHDCNPGRIHHTISCLMKQFDENESLEALSALI